ncbi:protein of unknown function [Taphrina deformans PYCC 5710]|uniref:Anaphase-promoting complex subunit 5 n=1 Tax=Taphrina deformans (strain PYCC 5710 / ATCC 11124 / CBS 356.35 / IMI 108563 / JCM 9778 / NBRC 8474) TaxID=1097556 RepID=R4XGV2_TAPDE|nr:protein of unknown function [Taphrina deformans PYCC 5710]|eukprot:CCG84917.1 protein of unknown function [Taphrina deformans PYCC 5710]
MRSLALAAKNTSLVHWSILFSAWEAYGQVIRTTTTVDTRSRIPTEASSVIHQGQDFSERRKDDGSQKMLMDVKTFTNNIIDGPSRVSCSVVDRITHNESIIAWRSGEYAQSISQLHRYHDYLGSQLNAACHQYALLDLALVQADFGCHKEALWAMCEAVDAARDNLDHSCLDFALIWLQDSQQHKMFTDQAYANHITINPWDHEHLTARDLKPLQMVDAHTPHIYAFADKLSALLRTRSITRNGTISALLASSSYWSDLDLEQLARLTLRLARIDSLTADDAEDNIRLRCATSQALFSRGMQAEARVLLDSIDDAVLKNNNVQKIWLTQHAIFRLREGHYTEDDLLLELQEIERDPMTIGPRVRRYIQQGQLVEAEDILHKYLEPLTVVAITRKTCQSQIMLLRLTSEIYLESSEPERAFIATVHALKLARTFHQYKAYRELMESMDIIAGVIEK